MRGKLSEYNALEGVLTVTVTDGDPTEWMAQYGDREVELSISDPKKKRSLDANAYAWVLIGKLAAKTRQPKEHIYLHMIRDIGDNYEILRMADSAVEPFRLAWKEGHLGRIIDVLDSDGKMSDVLVYYGSSDYDTNQMSVFLDAIISECKEQGIETMTPRERQELLDLWKERYGA